MNVNYAYLFIFVVLFRLYYYESFKSTIANKKKYNRNLILNLCDINSSDPLYVVDNLINNADIELYYSVVKVIIDNGIVKKEKMDKIIDLLKQGKNSDKFDYTLALILRNLYCDIYTKDLSSDWNNILLCLLVNYKIDIGLGDGDSLLAAAIDFRDGFYTNIFLEYSKNKGRDYKYLINNQHYRIAYELFYRTCKKNSKEFDNEFKIPWTLFGLLFYLYNRILNNQFLIAQDLKQEKIDMPVQYVCFPRSGSQENDHSYLDENTNNLSQ